MRRSLLTFGFGVEATRHGCPHQQGDNKMTSLVEWEYRAYREVIGKTFERLYEDSMKTLTITDAKKNLSQWLAAAARGQDIGIICGADIIALRKVDVESTDYAQREYGATPDQVAAVEEATNKRYRRLKRSGKLVTVNADQLRKMFE